MPIELSAPRIAAVTSLTPRHLADATGLDRPARFPEAIFTRSLRPHLQRTAIPLDRLATLDRLLDRQRQRLLAIDVLAGLHRFDRNLRVPMIGCGDHHRIDITIVQHVAILHGPAGLAALDDPHGAVQATPIDITHPRHEQVVARSATHQTACVAGPHAAGADHGQIQSIVCSQHPGPARGGAAQDHRRGGRGLNESTSCNRL